MKTASISDVQLSLQAYLTASKSEPIVITNRGKPVGVLLSADGGDELERLLLSYNPAFQSLVGKAKKDLRDGKGIPHDEFWRQVDADSIQATPRQQRRTMKKKA